MSYINDKGEIKMEPSLEKEEETINPDFTEIAHDISTLLEINDYETAKLIISQKYDEELTLPATNKGRTLSEYFNLPR